MSIPAPTRLDQQCINLDFTAHNLANLLISRQHTELGKSIRSTYLGLLEGRAAKSRHHKPRIRRR